jgi:septum site-determining protein MinD
VAKIVATHSFRGGTGKSNTTANLSCVLADEGQRVAVIDGDIQSPGIHVLFGMGGVEMGHSLNDFLWGECSIEQAAHDVTGNVGLKGGKLFLIPSSLKAGDIARVLRQGYDVSSLNDGLHQLIDALQLDTLLIDTHPGLNEETLLSLAIADALVIMLRPDQQDYLGTSVTVEVARKLGVPSIKLVVNKVPQLFDAADVRRKVEEAYSCEVAAIIPHSEELMALASGGIFSLHYPDHPVSALYREVARVL